MMIVVIKFFKQKNLMPLFLKKRVIVINYFFNLKILKIVYKNDILKKVIYKMNFPTIIR